MSVKMHHNAHIFEMLGTAGAITVCRYKSCCAADRFEYKPKPQYFIYDVMGFFLVIYK